MCVPILNPRYIAEVRTPLVCNHPFFREKGGTFQAMNVHCYDASLSVSSASGAGDEEAQEEGDGTDGWKATALPSP